MATLIL